MNQKRKRKKSDFEAWFEEQFGKQPISSTRYYQLWDTIPTLKQKLFKAERDAEEYERWQRSKRAASYAWQAQEKL